MESIKKGIENIKKCQMEFLELKKMHQTEKKNYQMVLITE